MTVQQLIDELNGLQKYLYQNKDDPALLHAIEAIRVLELIERYGGKTEELMGMACNGRWCAEQARSFFHSLKQK